MGSFAPAELHRPSGTRRQREIYIQMRREDDPDFSFISAQELRACINTAAKQPSISERLLRDLYPCLTQQTPTLDLVLRAPARSTLPLWAHGSVLRWAARTDGYPSPSGVHALRVASSMHHAAARWNAALGGRVIFRHAERATDAHFVLEYGGDGARALASSFTPEKAAHALNAVRVYSRALTPTARPLLMCALLHELGHVLGLRHEHAHSAPTAWLPDSMTSAQTAVWGACDPRSVLGFRLARDLSSTDVANVRAAYDELQDGAVVSGPGKFSSLESVVAHVLPAD